MNERYKYIKKQVENNNSVILKEYIEKKTKEIDVEAKIKYSGKRYCDVLLRKLKAEVCKNRTITKHIGTEKLIKETLEEFENKYIKSERFWYFKSNNNNNFKEIDLKDRVNFLDENFNNFKKFLYDIESQNLEFNKEIKEFEECLEILNNELDLCFELASNTYMKFKKNGDIERFRSDYDLYIRESYIEKISLDYKEIREETLKLVNSLREITKDNGKAIENMCINSMDGYSSDFTYDFINYKVGKYVEPVNKLRGKVRKAYRQVLYNKKEKISNEITYMVRTIALFREIYDMEESVYINSKIKILPKTIYEIEGEREIRLVIINIYKSLKSLDFKVNTLGESSKWIKLDNNYNITLGLLENILWKSLYEKPQFREKLDIINNQVKNKYNIDLGYIPFKLNRMENILFISEGGRDGGVKSINSIISSLITELPIGEAKFLLVDLSYAGRYYSDFNEIRRKSKSLVGEKLYTDKNEVLKLLDNLVSEILDITQNKLGSGYKDIYEYNKDNNDSKEQIKIVSIIGLYNLIKKSDALEKVMYLLTNGPRCGYYFLLDYNESEESSGSSYSNNYDDKIASKCLTFKVFKDSLWDRSNSIYIGFLNKIPYMDNIQDIYDTIAEELRKNEEVSFNIGAIKCEDSNNAAEELVIPIGKNNRGEVQNLMLGKGVSHHGLIAGQTGSGKSSLLHTIILSAIKNYTPDDLNIYLMDFKEGIEFKIYSKYKIPHIKLIALESQVEFGESILEYMVKEIQRRGKLFKSKGVENLQSYKEETGESLPRILLIIDEFTNLFNINNGRDITRNNAQLMKKIINQGRAFGVNVLMASQSIKDTLDSTLQDEALEQMAVRIGLKCSEKDAVALMGTDNNELNRLGSEIGAAVYNGENGRGENFKFRVAYGDSKERESILTYVEERFKDKYSVAECRVFEGNDSVDVENDMLSIFNNDDEIRKLKNYHNIWLGERIKIGLPVSIRFSPGQNNLIIISNDDEQINKILIYSIMSIVRQVRLKEGCKEPLITLLDYNFNLTADSDAFNVLVEGNSDLIETADSALPKHLITNLYNEFVRRRDNNELKSMPKYLIINGMQRARDLLTKSDRSSSISFSIGLDEKEKELGVSEMFEVLAKDGGDYGVFLICTTDTYRNYNRVIDKIGYWLKDCMNLRIAFNMNDDDGDRFVQDRSTETLNENTAIFYDDVIGSRSKFRIYKEPSKEWIMEKYI